MPGKMFYQKQFRYSQLQKQKGCCFPSGFLFPQNGYKENCMNFIQFSHLFKTKQKKNFLENIVKVLA